ncbi:MFS multidrug transporter-like protein [Pyronema omphalodes]|nr:MFS multidrug transporter-like protein [Pyronema omphalodes]
MALAASDAQVMYDSEQEKDYESGERHSRKSTEHDHSDNNTNNKEIEYRYLDWDTNFLELCTNPDELPKKIVKTTNPFEWGPSHKNWVLAMCCASTFVAAYMPGAYTSGLKQMEAEWNMSRVPLLVGVTVYTAGFAVAPMMLAPLSEVYGRRNVFLASYVLFNFMHLGTALCNNYAGMLVIRFIAGIGGSTFSTICGGIISDLYTAKDRGFPMACFSTMALFGTGAGPLASGFIAENMNWRWIHWIQLIFNGILMLLSWFFMKETRGSVLLIRRAKALNKLFEQQDARAALEKTAARGIRFKVLAEEERASLSAMVKISLTRPFYLLFTEPVVFFFSLWVSFSWGVLYLFLQGVPLVFSVSHGFTISQVGSVFTSMCVGSLLALFLNTIVERCTAVYLPNATGPETRLYAACSLGALLPIGMFWFGWTSFPNQHWILPTIAVGAATIGIYSIYLAVFNYFADTYHRYASSALAAQSFCRNALGGCFPLFTDAFYYKMTFQGASSFLGGVGLLLSIVPWVLVFYGDRIRGRSKFAKGMV